MGTFSHIRETEKTLNHVSLNTSFPKHFEICDKIRAEAFDVDIRKSIFTVAKTNLSVHSN